MHTYKLSFIDDPKQSSDKDHVILFKARDAKHARQRVHTLTDHPDKWPKGSNAYLWQLDQYGGSENDKANRLTQ